jgi:outer membrane biogenesis lipoprotein LolB
MQKQNVQWKEQEKDGEMRLKGILMYALMGVKYGRQCVEIVGNVGSLYGKASFRTEGL